MTWKSPLWFVPIVVVAMLALVEGIHISMHKKYCMTEAEWMNQQEGMTYDRESMVND